MYKNILFDADGTLLDTIDGIHAAFNYARNKQGEPLFTREQVKPFIGPTLMDTLHNTLGYPLDEATEGVKIYREFYWDKGYKMCDLYPGIKQLLKDLKQAGKKLCVATNKAQPFIDMILKEKGIFKYFDLVVGPDLITTSTDKTPLVKKAILSSPAVMVGDRYIDIVAAKNNDIDSIGVNWGSAEEGEFIKYGATHVVSSVSEIYTLCV